MCVEKMARDRAQLRWQSTTGGEGDGTMAPLSLLSGSMSDTSVPSLEAG